jgi:hypothetical protein
MVDAHCGFPVVIPPSGFTPEKQASHVYIPSNVQGIVTKIKGENFERLPTYYAHALLAEVGEPIEISKSLGSFAAQLWLIGEPADVDRDAKIARDEFKLEVEEPLPKVDETASSSPISVPSV